MQRIHGRRDEFIHKDIFTPRSYQVELLDSALTRNTIVCLSSSTGKSFISVLLIKELSHHIRKAYRSGGKRTLFLASDASHIKQYVYIVRLYTDLNVGDYSEDKPVICHKELINNEVLVMPARSFLAALQVDTSLISSINLLLLDDCHNVLEDGDPYKQIMEIIAQCGECPRILGLTESIMSGQCKTPHEIKSKIKQLEASLMSTAETSDPAHTETYASKPQEIILPCDTNEEFSELEEEIGAILKDALKFIQDCNFSQNDKDPCAIPTTVFKECLGILRELGPWCCSCVAEGISKQLSKLIDVEESEMSKHLLWFTHTQLRMVIVIFKLTFDRTMDLEEFLSLVRPKVLKLRSVLLEYMPDSNFQIIGEDDYMAGAEASDSSDEFFSDDEANNSQKPIKKKVARKGKSKANVHYVAVRQNHEKSKPGKKEEDVLCGVIFIESSYATFALNKLIQELCNWDPDLYFIHSCHITGRGKSTSKDSDAFKKQEDILKRFRSHEYNLLITTSAVDEDIDIPKCNLVVRFGLPVDYKGYVQSKSRTKTTGAKYIMLACPNELEVFKYELNMFKEIEQILKGRAEENSMSFVSSDSEEDIVSDDVLPPYRPVADSSVCVTMSSAIALVNRYCAKLPSDAFTHLAPRCKTTQTSQENGAGHKYISTLQLPINSPVKEPIVGPPMQNEKLAEMAVALKTCEILHKSGELDNHLLPVGKEVIKYSEEAGFEDDDDDLSSQALPGSTKRKQYYNKKFGDVLLDCQPVPGEPCYMYIIDMTLTSPMTEEQNTRGRKIFSPESTQRGFAILSTKKMSMVPLFPVFTRSGEVTISIEESPDMVTISSSQLDLLLNFHHYTFHGVLRLVKQPMVFSPSEAKCNYVIVPVLLQADESHVIDWSFALKISESKPYKKRVVSSNKSNGEDKQKVFEFRNNDFEDSVVMPSYRNTDQPQFFYVAEIRNDLNPESAFPSPELYQTFHHYYTSKYGLEITNLTQPLLDVDHTSVRLNLLTPRYMNQKGIALPTSSAETKRARRESLQQKQILIPELCDIHPFPASLWRKAVCLPAILYRVNYLLVANELRILISTESKIGQPDLPTENFRFTKLNFGFETSPNLISANKCPKSKEVVTITEISEEIIGNGVQKSNHELNHVTPELNCDTLKCNDQCLYNKHNLSTAAKSVPQNNICSNDKNKLCHNENQHNANISNNHLKPSKFDQPSKISFDHDVDLRTFVGPNPCTILQTLTMSNANDFYNLERLETVGDSFLKFAITTYLYCTYPGIHEGKLSYLRSKQVSNKNLYYLGQKKGLPERMVATKFEPSENWLPPGYVVKYTDRYPGIKVRVAVSSKEKPKKRIGRPDPPPPDQAPVEEEGDIEATYVDTTNSQQMDFYKELQELTIKEDIYQSQTEAIEETLIPYTLQTQHSLPDKSIADCVEALIGCYLTTCGPRAALILMSWFGLKVIPMSNMLPCDTNQVDIESLDNLTLQPPPSPLLTHVENARHVVQHYVSGYESFEQKIGYTFQDKAYLLQALTHASYHFNGVTDCYQRLEFLGDAILDYIITRHLFEDNKRHSPGVLTDLRSALVNNNIFAALAVKWDFHKYFKAVSPQLFNVIEKFVTWQKMNNDQINMEDELFYDDDLYEEQQEDIEIPKALGDIFESVAGAIYLDSGMSLDTVWNVYYNLMKEQIDQFTEKIPKSPVRELLEMEPETAKFEKPERTMDGKIRVMVNVVGKGSFRGIGRNYRIAKSAAAKRALRFIKMLKVQTQEMMKSYKQLAEKAGMEQ